MIKANIQAQIDAKQLELFKIHEDVLKLDRLIEGITKQKNILLDQESDLMYECKELQDQLEEDV